MSHARFAPITAGLLARKGNALPSAMASHHPAPVFVETPRPVAQPSVASAQDNHDQDTHPPHDPTRPKKLFISLSHREHERLAIAAVKTGLDRHQLVRDALEAYFEQLSRDMREGCACMSGAKTCGCDV